MNPTIQEKLDLFFRSFKNHHYKKNDIIINPDEDPGGINFIKSGIIRMYSVSPEGEEMVVNIFKPGAFFPMGWLLNNTPIKHYYEAEVDSEIVKAPKERFLEFLQTEPDVLMDLVRRIYRGLDGYMMKMETLMSGNARNKLLTTLLIYAKRFGIKSPAGLIINSKLTEKELASQSGLVRETVSREIKKLKQKGLIQYEKNILTVHDISKLEIELESI